MPDLDDQLADLELRVTRDITPGGARDAAAVAGEIDTSPPAVSRPLAATRRLETSAVTLANRESFVRVLRVAIAEGAHVMCDPGVTNAQRVSIAAFVDSALAVLAFL